MQYYAPSKPHFVGDCMPFFHDGVFHLFYLIDENHHQAKKGLGGHQWANATTTDLIHWEHHPMALPITRDYEASICTGSVFHHEGTFYAFYATRTMEHEEYMSLAKSTDGIHFDKISRDPLFKAPPPYQPTNFRDPFVFHEENTGLFHMLVASALDQAVLPNCAGCLAHFTSYNLTDWKTDTPFIIPGYPGVPECPDYFFWNGWYYLFFSIEGVAHYRMSRNPLGPWLHPGVDTLDSPMACVMKTAAFSGNRRIGVAFIPSLENDKDNGRWLYAGNALFRELIQLEDGILGTRFVPEMMPATGSTLDLPLKALTRNASINGRSIHLKNWSGYEAAIVENVPRNAYIKVSMTPQPGSYSLGLRLRAAGNEGQGYELRISPGTGRVEVRKPGRRSCDYAGEHAIDGVENLDRHFDLVVILKDDIIDVCIDDRRCLVSRFPELQGERLLLTCHDGEVVYDKIEVRPLKL